MRDPFSLSDGISLLCQSEMTKQRVNRTLFVDCLIVATVLLCQLPCLLRFRQGLLKGCDFLKGIKRFMPGQENKRKEIRN